MLEFRFLMTARTRRADQPRTLGLVLLAALVCGAAAQVPPSKRPSPPRRPETKAAQPPGDANSFGVQFVDVTREAGIHFHHERAASQEKFFLETMGAGLGWLDYDQDGFLDAFFVNSGYTPLFHPPEPPQPALYHNNGDGTFTDVTARSGIHSDGIFFFGIAVGDYDNDGGLDLLVSNNGEEAQLFRNQQGPNRNHWIGVRLIGTKSNRDGIGARLKLVAGGLVSYDQTKGGMSYCSAQDPRIHFGLGRKTKVDSLEILWPSGDRQVLKDIPVDEYITVKEGEGITSYHYPVLRRLK